VQSSERSKKGSEIPKQRSCDLMEIWSSILKEIKVESAIDRNPDLSLQNLILLEVEYI
jgi:hypothetical protein